MSVVMVRVPFRREIGIRGLHQQPAYHHQRQQSAKNFSDDEARQIDRVDSGEVVRQRAGNFDATQSEYRLSLTALGRSDLALLSHEWPANALSFAGLGASKINRASSLGGVVIAWVCGYASTGFVGAFLSSIGILIFEVSVALERIGTGRDRA
jgi:hypothetical protein